MRILVSTQYDGLVGGAETYLETLLPALIERGHSLALLTVSPPSIKLPELGPRLPLLRASIQSLGLIGARSWVEEFRPEVVFHQGFDAIELEEFLVRRFTTLLFAHGYYGTCVSGTKRMARPISHPCTHKFGAGCLGNYFPYGCGGKNPLTALKLFGIEGRRHAMLSQYSGIVVGTEHMWKEYLNNGSVPERTHLASYPIADTRSAMAKKPFAGNLLFLGRLTDLKGPHYLLRAMHEISSKVGRIPLRLVIAGDGPARSSLHRLAGSLGLRVRFAGWVGPRERPHLLDEADLLVVPSLWPEPFGLVGLEAAQRAVPSVAFSVGGIPEWLEPGVSGELAEGDPPTVGGLVEAIVRAVGNEAHFQNLREGAWRSVERFPITRHIQLLERAFSSAVAFSAL